MSDKPLIHDHQKCLDAFKAKKEAKKPMTDKLSRIREVISKADRESATTDTSDLPVLYSRFLVKIEAILDEPENQEASAPEYCDDEPRCGKCQAPYGTHCPHCVHAEEVNPPAFSKASKKPSERIKELRDKRLVKAGLSVTKMRPKPNDGNNLLAAEVWGILDYLDERET